MSNYLSQPIKYAAPPTDANFELLSKVALMQQQKYDVNHQQIQATLDQFGAMKTLRPEDDAYIAAKLNDITTQANAMGGNLANQSVSDSLMSKVKAAAQDPFILNAFEQTAKMSSYQKELAVIKEKKPELYNDVNNSYALDQAGYADYMAGKTDKMGTLSYTAYTDYKKEFKDFSENLDKYSNVVKTTRPGGDGYTYTQDGKYLSQEKIESMVGSLLSEGAKKQMQIDGWSHYNVGATDEAKLANVTKSFSEYKTQALQDIDSRIHMAEGDVSSTPNDPERQQTVANLKDYKKQLEKSYNEMITTGNKSGMYTEMYIKQTIGTFANAFAFNNVSQTIAEDTAYSHAVDMQYKLAKDTAAAAAKVKEDVTSVQTKTDENYQVPGGTESLFQDQSNRVDMLTEGVEAETNRVYNTLSAADKRAIDAEVKKGINKTDALLNKGLESDKFISVTDAEKITMLKQEANIEKERLTKYIKQATDEATVSLDSKETVKELISNPDAKIMWRTTAGTEMLMPAKKVLLATGVIDNEGNVLKSMGTKTGLLDAVKKTSILAELSNTASLTPIRAESLRKQLGELSGEDYLKSTEFRKFGDVVTDYRVYKKGSKLLNLENIFNNQGGDDTILGLSAIKKYKQEVDSGAIQKRVGELLFNDSSTNLGIGRVTTVKPGTTQYKDLAAVSEQFTQGSQYSLGIRLIPNQPNMVSITQKVAPTAKDPNPAPTTVTMKITDLPKSITSQIDLQNKKAIFTAENMPPTPAHVVYVKDDPTRQYTLAKAYLGGSKLPPEALKAQSELLTTEGATTAIFNDNPTKLGTVTKPTELGSLVQQIINDKNLHVVFSKQKLSDETIVIPQVVRKVNGVTTVVISGDPFTGRVTDDNAEASFKMARFIPQMYLNTFLNNLVKSANAENYIPKFKQIYGQQ